MDQCVVHTLCRPVYTVRIAKEEEGGEDDRNEGVRDKVDTVT